MTISRTLTVLSLTLAILLAGSQAAKADNLRDIFHKVGQVKAHFGGGPQHHGPQHHGPRFGHPQPPSHCYRPPKCPSVCPPPCPPPVRICIYCVYYLDCHGHWHLYQSYRDRFEAESAASRIQQSGYRTYIKVKHVSGGLGSGYPGPGLP